MPTVPASSSPRKKKRASTPARKVRARKTTTRKKGARRAASPKKATTFAVAKKTVRRKRTTTQTTPRSTTPVAPPPQAASASSATLRPADIFRGGMFLLAIAAFMAGGLVIKNALAATYTEPSAAPPGGNIPVTIWNRESTNIKQTNAAIAIDGYASFDQTLSVGSAGYDLGATAGGQNVIYGVGSYSLMNPADYLFLLQTENSGTFTNRFRVDRNGSVVMTGSLTASGTVHPYGSLNAGSPNYNLGSTTTGQNVIYGVARYEYMNPTGDNLLKLQTYTGGVYTDRLTVNRDGDVDASGCFGPTLVGLTSSSYKSGVSPVLSYYGANNACAGDFPGSHVCTAGEMLRSISCSKSGDPIRTLGGEIAWINGGPPGFTSNANDCVGWTSSTSSAYGRYWSFNDTTGGFGTMTSCNAPGLKFACCK